MPGTLFVGAVERSIGDKFGERISVLDFGAVADGSTDCSDAFNLAIGAAHVASGSVVYVPRGSYVLESPVLMGEDVLGVELRGDGEGSLLLRGASMPAGQGLIDIAGSRLTISNLSIDGQVTTAVGKQYGTFIGENSSDDPMHADLTANTSVWVHPGARDVRFSGISIRHTGGYTILLDARTGDIIDVSITDSLFENNRPHLFGTSAGDMNYGSWTGGIHYQSDSRSAYSRLYSVRNMLVRNCTFRRNTGNQIWGHLYGFDKLHENHRIEGCHFEDIGRDGVMCGGLLGGAVRGNTFRRIGYIATDDTSAAVPKFLANNYAVGLDTAGLVRGVAYADNSFVSCYGGCMDLDGYADGAVTGNTCIVPLSGSPEYAEDQIASWSIGNWTYGAQVSNSNNLASAAAGVSITGNRFVNCGGGGVRLYASRRCHVSGNIVEHDAAANVAPFQLGNIGSGDYQRSYDNVVAENTIYYNPASPVGAIQENPNGFAFQATDKNWIYGNRIFGSAFEFLKDTNSGSTTAARMTTSAVASAVSANAVQREGTGATAVLRWYKVVGTTETATMNLLDTGPLLNVSDSGARYSGKISTGQRTTLALGDIVATGKLYGDAFLAMADGEYRDTDADTLNTDAWGLIRYNSTSKKFEQSVAVSGGARVWTDLAGSSSSLPSWLTLADSPRLMRLTGEDATSGATLKDSPDVSLRGAYWSGSASVASDALMRHVVLSSSSSRLRVWHASYAMRLGVGSAGGAQTIDLYHDGTDGNIAVSTGSLRLPATVIAGSGTILSGGSGNFAFDASGNMTIVAVAAANGGFNTTNTAYNAIQAANGGVNAKWLTATVALTMAGTTEATATLSGAGQGRIFFDSSLNKFRVSQNGGAYEDLVKSTGLTGSLTSGRVPYATGASTLADESVFVWQTATKRLGVNKAAPGTTLHVGGQIYADGAASGAGITCADGYIESTEGFYSGYTSYQTFQSPSGGMYARSLRASTYTQVGQNSGAPTATSGDAFVAGAMYWDTGSGALKAYNGSSWLTLATGGVSSVNSLTGAVTLAAGTGITITPSGNTLTFATTAYGSGADANFNSVTLPNVGYVKLKNSGGTARNVLSMQANNAVYLDNTSEQDIYVRPGSGRYVFLGYGSGGAGEHVCPNGNAAANLGHTSYRWGTLYVQSINFSSSGGYSGGTGISVSGATITNTGVTSLSAGTGVSVNASTGAVTVSIGQAVGTSSAVSFYSVATSDGIQINKSSGYGLYLPNSYVYSNGINSLSTANNGIQSAGGVQASNGFYIASGSLQVINSSGAFVGAGVNVGANGISGGGYNVNGGYIGQTWNVYSAGGFVIGGSTYYTLVFRGGILVSAS